MKIGVPKEVKADEYRVGLVPALVRELCVRKHEVFVETGAGVGIGFDDDAYRASGATIVDDADSVFQRAELIVKVKEPQPAECQRLREGQILFTFLHVAADRQLAEDLMASGCVAIAYETVTDAHGGLPLLAPMSEVAGRFSIQAGARCLEKSMGGAGVLLGGVPGVPAAKVTVIGGGVVGTNALRMALGMEAHVTILDKSLNRLRQLDFQFGASISTVFASESAIEQIVADSDLVIGAVLVPGAKAPRLVRRELLKEMRDGSVLVDVAIDQGGCFETSRPTSHSEPTFAEHGVVHYCVTNMPGAVPRTSTFALNNATIPYIFELAEQGVDALKSTSHFLAGLNVCKGTITHKAVSESLKLPYRDPLEALSSG